jgi:hypothetical protein
VDHLWAPATRQDRYKVAAEFAVDEALLWPDALSGDQVAAVSANELITLYPHRWAVPDDLWDRLFTAAQREIDILVYSGLFLAEDTGVQRLLAAKARAGVRKRLLLGDPGSDAVADRGGSEGIDDATAARIRNALVLLRPLLAIDGVEVRLHRTVLYNSIYRADDQALVNAHVHGVGAPNAPMLHLRRAPAGICSSSTRTASRASGPMRPLPLIKPAIPERGRSGTPRDRAHAVSEAAGPVTTARLPRLAVETERGGAGRRSDTVLAARWSASGRQPV